MDSLYTETMAALETSLVCGMIGSPVQTQGIELTDALSNSEVQEFAMPRGYWQVFLRAADPSAGAAGEIVELDPETYEVLIRRPVEIADLLASSTPIGRAIEFLNGRRFFLLLEHDRIDKILTRADLNRLPVRTYLHTLLDHLEAVLGVEIATAHPEDSWLELLSDNAAERANSLLKKKQQDGLDTALIDCTTFSDKANIILKTGEGIAARLDIETKADLKHALNRIRKLRDRLAHPEPIVVEDVELIRNQLRHGDRLTRSCDVTKLAQAVALLRDWVAILDE